MKVVFTSAPFQKEHSGGFLRHARDADGACQQKDDACIGSLLPCRKANWEELRCSPDVLEMSEALQEELGVLRQRLHASTLAACRHMLTAPATDEVTPLAGGFLPFPNR